MLQEWIRNTNLLKHNGKNRKWELGNGDWGMKMRTIFNQFSQ